MAGAARSSPGQEAGPRPSALSAAGAGGAPAASPVMTKQAWATLRLAAS